MVVVCRLHYTLKQAYKETSTDEKTVVNSYSNDLPYQFAVNFKTNFLRCIGYLSSTKSV